MYKVNKHGGDGLWVLSLVLVISVFQDFFVYIWFDYFWVFTFRILHTTWGDKRWESGTSHKIEILIDSLRIKTDLVKCVIF